MDSTSDGVIETGGGAAFHGDLTAARDINIYHFTTQIRQSIQGLSQCCETRDISEGLRTKISTLRSIAETTEDHARALQADVSMNDPRLKVSLLECKNVLIELQNLAKSIEGGGEGSALRSAEITECNSVVTDLRGRLSSIQACLSGCEARKLREDHILIKEALHTLFQEQSNAREPSICSFYTAHSLPIAEREEWHEIEKGLREHGLTPQLIQRHLEFIVDSLGEYILGSIPTDQGDQRSISNEPLHDQTVYPAEHTNSTDLDSSVIQSGNLTNNLVEVSDGWSDSQVLEVLADPPNAVVDITFMHSEFSEKGQPRDIWTYKSNRLLSYLGHMLGKDSKNNSVYNIEKLFSRLSEIRIDSGRASTWPVISVAHRVVGQIVIEVSIRSSADECDPDYIIDTSLEEIVAPGGSEKLIELSRVEKPRTLLVQIQ